MPRHSDVPDLTLQRGMERQISQGTVGPILLSAPGQDLRCPHHAEIAGTSKGTALGWSEGLVPILREVRAEKPVIAASMVLFAEVETGALGRPLNSSQLTLETAIINCNPIHLQEILYYCLQASS